MPFHIQFNILAYVCKVHVIMRNCKLKMKTVAYSSNTRLKSKSRENNNYPLIRVRGLIIVLENARLAPSTLEIHPVSSAQKCKMFTLYLCWNLKPSRTNCHTRKKTLKYYP